MHRYSSCNKGLRKKVGARFVPAVHRKGDCAQRACWSARTLIRSSIRTLAGTFPQFPLAGDLTPRQWPAIERMREVGTALISTRNRSEYGWSWRPAPMTAHALSVHRNHARAPKVLGKRHQAASRSWLPSGWRLWPSSSLQVPSACRSKTPSACGLTTSCFSTKHFAGLRPGARPYKIAAPLLSQASRHTAPGIQRSSIRGIEVGAEVRRRRSLELECRQSIQEASCSMSCSGSLGRRRRI